MGSCSGRQHYVKDNYFVGQNIFIKLKAEDMLEQYKTIKVIGSGGYGEVREVKHKKTQTERVMKVIKRKKDAEDAEDQEAMFFTEVQTYLIMDHPHVMRIYETYQDHKNYYIISEYLRGGNLLERVIKNKANITEQKISSYMKQVLLGLSHCHALGITHRDIKPDNILFESQDDESLKIIDFGVAKIKTKKDNDEDDQKIIGTHQYLAPEMLKKLDTYTEKVDVWSTGLMLHQLLTGGQFPFNADKTLNFTKLDDPKKGISNEVKDLIKKMVQPDQYKRISIAQALEHQWIKNPNKIKIKDETLENLKNFHAAKKVQSAIIYMIQTELSKPKEKEVLKQQFQAIDVNHDGTLDYTELQNAYQERYGDPLKAQQIAMTVMKKADLDKNEKIEFSEFVVTTLKITEQESKEKLERAFSLLDLNQDGQITMSELQKVMGFGVKKEQFKEFINTFDRDRDGKINKKEFVDGFHEHIKESQFRETLRQSMRQPQ